MTQTVSSPVDAARATVFRPGAPAVTGGAVTALAVRREAVGAAWSAKPMLKMGQLVAATGATPRAIRHYESLGLLIRHPRIGRQRQFSPDQCDILALIVVLRRLDIPIPAIRPLVDAGRPAAERLAQARALMIDRQAELSRQLSAVTVWLEDSDAVGSGDFAARLRTASR